MLRRLMFAAAAVAALSPLTTSAQAVIPSHVNIHNGFIEVRNQIQYLNGASGDMKVVLKREKQIMQEVHVAPGHSAFLNVCCILAGTLYDVVLDGRAVAVATIRPQLCNVRGIPFGYGVVVFTGHLRYNAKMGFDAHFEPHVPAVSCPVASS